MDNLLSLETYQTVLYIAFGYMAFIFVGAFFAKSPYGRFSTSDAKFNLQPQFGWFLMELPATLSFVFFYFQGDNRFETVPLIFLGLWLIHYGNRGFVFPMLMRVAKGEKGSFGIIIVITGWAVTSIHGYLNAVFISHLSDHMTNAWLTDPRFIVGMMLWLCGFSLNVHADAIVRNLRTKEEVARGERNYRIPEGGLFKYVTCPSYFAELISFTGIAIATWGVGALFVLGVSAANLIPRAFQTHKWYLEKFPDYPKTRKVIFPGIL